MTCGMVNILSTFQIPSSYGLGVVEKLHVRCNSIDNRQSFFCSLGDTGAQMWCKGTKKKFRWFLNALYSPLANIKPYG